MFINCPWPDADSDGPTFLVCGVCPLSMTWQIVSSALLNSLLLVKESTQFELNCCSCFAQIKSRVDCQQLKSPSLVNTHCTFKKGQKDQWPPYWLSSFSLYLTLDSVFYGTMKTLLYHWSASKSSSSCLHCQSRQGTRGGRGAKGGTRNGHKVTRHSQPSTRLPHNSTKQHSTTLLPSLLQTAVCPSFRLLASTGIVDVIQYLGLATLNQP